GEWVHPAADVDDQHQRRDHRGVQVPQRDRGAGGMKDVMLFTLAVVVSAACAGLMGFAIQRGGTCTVAAVDELLTQRKTNRLLAMGEASLWVAGGLALASVVQWHAVMPAAYPVSAWVFAGGALLG